MKPGYTLIIFIGILTVLSQNGVIGVSLNQADTKKLNDIKTALDKLGIDKTTADKKRSSLACNLTPPFDPKASGVCKDVCDFGNKWAEAPVAIAKKAAEKCACSCARTGNNFTWDYLTKRIGLQKFSNYDPYFTAGIDLKQIDSSSFPSAQTLEKNIADIPQANSKASIYIRGNRCDLLSNSFDAKTKKTCESVCALGRGWNLMPNSEAVKAGLNCACYCKSNGHPQAAETLRNIVIAKYGPLTINEVKSLGTLK